MQDGSPGHKAGLEAFFDFIVAIGNTRLVIETKEFLLFLLWLTVILNFYSQIFVVSSVSNFPVPNILNYATLESGQWHFERLAEGKHREAC